MRSHVANQLYSYFIFIITRTHIVSVVQCHNKLMNDSAVPTLPTAADKLFHLGMVLGKKLCL